MWSVLLLIIYLGAYAGLEIGTRLGLSPEARIACGFLGCFVASLLIVARAVAGRVRRRAG